MHGTMNLKFSSLTLLRFVFCGVHLIWVYHSKNIAYREDVRKQGAEKNISA
jgi:hypothetical protein